MSERRKVAPKSIIVCFVLFIAFVICFGISDIRWHLNGGADVYKSKRMLKSLDVEIPDATHGVLSVMQKAQDIDNPPGYVDAVDCYLRNLWPDDMLDTCVLHFDTDIEECGGELSLSLDYDEATGVVTSQTLDFSFCFPFTFDYSLADYIVETVDDYIGVEYSTALVRYYSWYAGRGDGLSVHGTDGVDLVLKTCPFGGDDHMNASIHFVDMNIDLL